MSVLRGRTALVTGAGSGIGAAIARAFDAEGMNVVLSGRRREKLEEVEASLEGAGVRTLVQPADVTSEEDVRNAIAQTVERFGAIDVMVNNAGVGLFKPIADLTVEEFDRVVDVDLRGVFLCTKFALERMYEAGGGAIVTISSIAGKNGFAGGSVYCAAKFGVMGLMESVFHEAREHDVRVITITPGSVDTPFFDDAHMTVPNRDRVLQPEDVASTVVHALMLPQRALIRELDIRPSNPGKRSK